MDNTILERAIRQHELNKHLQLLPRTDDSTLRHNPNESPFAFALPESDTLRDALATYMELMVARLAVLAAFVVLTDGHTQYFLAGAKRELIDDDESKVTDASWLGTTDADKSIWTSLFQRTVSVDGSSIPPRDRLVELSPMGGIDSFYQLSSVTGPPHLSFYAGTPITSKRTINIGTVFVVDDSTRSEFSESEGDFLTATANKCMQLLEFAREREFRDRWALLNIQLDRFVRSRDDVAQVLPEPTGLQVNSESQSLDTEIEQVKDIVSQNGMDRAKIEEAISPEHAFTQGSESRRILNTGIARDDGIACEDDVYEARESKAACQDAYNARESKTQSDSNDKRGITKGETNYQKVFRRAAECLQVGLQADGVMFSDGLVGSQRTVRETKPSSHRKPDDSDNSPQRFRHWQRQYPREERAKNNPPRKSVIDGEATTMLTSAKYCKEVRDNLPAEIMELHTRREEPGIPTANISESTLGMIEVDKRFLQQLMDHHPNGNVWYFHSETNATYSVKNDTLSKNAEEEETHRISLSFPGIRQLIFQPLTDPISLKRLVGCFIWSMQAMPIFTDTVDLSVIKGFLRLVEAEISRLDTVAAMKQKETFVSSISHELRTPLHGILGAVQLLGDTDLDHFQNVLASTIKSCSSTLHETLSSVLSYAGINQFERRQQEHRSGRPPDSTWALADKHGVASSADRDFTGLYMPVNIAMLCEEIVRMLEAGLVYSKSKGGYDLIVILNIRYEDNWCFDTEPGALRRIVANILGNAMKYTPKGSVTITLTASEETDISTGPASGRLVNLTITDTGKGMSKDFVEQHLFLPFTQEHANTSEGVGLGMSIVKSLVSLLGGEILVKSDVGVGTEIRISTPMRTATADQTGLEQAALEFQQDVGFLRSKHLSVVVFGFPGHIRDSVELYLREWFQCVLLEITNDQDPDIVIIEEGNTEARDTIENSAPRYGHLGVLLSIVMDPLRLGEKMEDIKGYPHCERLPRPLGPRYLSRALISCVQKLKQIRKGKHTADGNENRREMEGRTSSSSTIDSIPSPITNKSGGTRSVYSAPGSMLSMTRRGKNGHADEGEWAAPSSKHISNLRILAVDDNALNIRLLGAFLKKYGCQNIQQAENGAEAVKTVREHTEAFDIIFMDLSMPVMDGFDATRNIRTIEYERSYTRQLTEDPVPSIIIALTGLASDREEKKAYASGVDFFITKPVRFAGLEQLLKQHEDGSLWRSSHRSE